MSYELDAAGTERLDEYFERRIGKHLRDHRKRASFATYAFGILGDGERKSAEPIAVKACGDPDKARAAHEKLLHVLGRSRWSDRAVRLEAARYALEAMFAKEPVTTWIIDDTGFLKQGTHSVGVQRQYTGSAGKIANCQIGVSLCIATPTEHLPVDLELYLPEAWAHSPARRRKARIPDEVTFKTKIELAIGMMRRATEARLPGDLVLADSFYGRCSVFRAAIRELKKEYAVAVDAGARVWAVDAAGRRYGDAGTVRQLAGQQGHRAFRRYLWRDGTRDALVSRLCPHATTQRNPTSESGCGSLQNGPKKRPSRPSSCSAPCRRD